ncbi:MAG: T9SS type A sorting domain-containing protein, partial [Bacteroidota bacterium]|nr:T9SS type A sorting domain-containing protein [Bacteroidota bacterium]
TYTVTITDDNSMVTVATYNLTEPAAIATTNTFTLCAGSSVTVGSNTYNTSGVYTDVIAAFNGCDSTVTTNLTVNPAISSSQAFTLCSGGSITVGANTYNTSGVYTDVFAAFNGCDSTVTTNLTVNPAMGSTQTFSICSGNSISVGANTYSMTGVYTDILTAPNGCDSTVTTNLTVNPTFSVSQSLTICNGSSVTVGSSVYTTSGTYTDMLSTVNSCDSAVTTMLTVLPTAATSQTLSICMGTSVTVGTSVYTVAGTYTDILNTTGGCDSTVTTNLSVLSVPVVNLNAFTMDTICFQSGAVTLPAGTPAGGAYTGPGVLPGIFNPGIVGAGVGTHTIVYTFTGSNGCSASDNTNITVLDCTGIEDNTVAQNISVYPNPTNGLFNIAVEISTATEMTILVTNIQGKQVYSSVENATAGSLITIDLSSVSKGIYFVKVNSGSAFSVSKLIVQ